MSLVTDIPGHLHMTCRMLRLICSYVLSYFTKQIAHGVGFRFETVKDVFYTEIFADTDIDDVTTLIPDIYNLTQNFRTHSGIIEVANSVVQLLVKIFPYSIDALPPEVSREEGPRPILLDSSRDLVVELFYNEGVKICDFGAEQVILVRDDDTKQKLMTVTNRRALILTIVEAKGMEFTDCLVYNFFKGSPLLNDWRVLYGFFDIDKPHPDFDRARHAALCGELKLLYVVLTRARQNLVIFDDDDKCQVPMLDYWLKDNLVTRKKFDESIRDLFIVNSTPEQWAAKGEIFWERRQYANARFCFERAGNDYRVQLCHGAELEQRAEQESSKDVAMSIALYLEAAEVYAPMNEQTERQAICLDKGKKYLQAGHCYLKVNLLRDACRCFMVGEEWNLAIMVCEQSKDWELGLKCCDKLKDFDKAISLLTQYEDIIPGDRHVDLMDQYNLQGALITHRKGYTEKVKEYVKKFSSVEDQLQFFELYGLVDDRVEMLIFHRHFEEAAQLLEKRYQYKEAANYYEQGGNVSCSSRCLVKYVRRRIINDEYLLNCDVVAENEEICESAIKARDLLESLPATLTNRLLTVETQLLIAGHDLVCLYESIPEAPAAASTKFHVLRLLCSSNTASIECSWRTLYKYAVELHNIIKLWLTALHKLRTSGGLRNMAPKEMQYLLSCLSYFEVSLNDTNTLTAKYIEGDGSVKGIVALLHEDRRGKNTSTVHFSFNEFANAAVTFLSNVYFVTASCCAAKLKDIISNAKLAPHTWESVINHAENRNAMVHSTQERMDLYHALHLLNLSCPHIEDAVLSKVKKDRRKAEARNALTHLVGIVLPSSPFVESMHAVELLRKNRDVMELLRTSQFDGISGSGSNYEAITKYLLLSEVTKNQGVVAKSLEQSISDFYSARRRAASNVEHVQRDLKADYGMNLLYAYQWENAADGVNPAGQVEGIGSFLYSLSTGCLAIIDDFFYGSIYQNLMKLNGKYKFCFSPFSFLKLVEKYFVLLMLEMKQCQDVVLPDVLVRDVLCRDSPSYVKAILRFREASKAEKSEATKNCRWYAKKTLQKLMKAILDIFEVISEDNPYENWRRSSVSDVSCSEFSTRLVLIFLTYYANLPVDKRTYNEFYECTRRLSTCNIRSSDVIKNRLHRFQFSKSKLLEVLCSSFSSFGIVFECYHWSHLCSDVPRYCSQHNIDRQIVDIADERCVVLVSQRRELVSNDLIMDLTNEDPVGDTDESKDFDREVAPPTDVDYFEKRIQENRDFFISFFRIRRRLVSQRGPLHRLQQDMEQRFFDLKLSGDMWCVEHYVRIVCPQLLQLFTLHDNGNAYVDTQSQEKVSVYN